MEQTTQEASKTPKGGFTVVLNFRAQPEDAVALKNEAERLRTNVSSVVRGALVQVGLLDNHNKGEEVNDGVQIH